MRILHVYSGNLWGGIERYLVTLARHRAAVPEIEHSFALCFEGELARQLRAAGAELSVLGPVRLRQPWTVILARRRLARLTRERRIDQVVFHSFWPWALLGAAPLGKGVERTLYLHDAVTGSTWVERLARWRTPDRLIANSRYTAGTARGLFPGGPPLQVLYYPVEPAPGSDADRSEVRASLGIGAEEVVLVQASRMEAWKGHRLLLEALAQLGPELRFRCLLVGGAQRPAEAAYVEQLRERIGQLGLGDRVSFLGQRDDVGRLLAGADLLVQPNLRPEPFGIVLVEALWAGLPVVTADLGGAAEVVDEGCGFSVRNEPAEVARAIRRLVEDPVLRRSLAARARPRAQLLCEPALRMADLAVALGAVR